MKGILVGLDGSSRAPSVLAAAIEIGRAQGARVVLLRSVGMPPDVPQDFWKTTDEPLLEVLKRRAEQYLREQAEAKVVNHAHCSVLVVREPQAHLERL